MGGGFIGFDKETNRLYRDRGVVSMYFDPYIKGVPLKLSFSVMTADITDTLVADRDTIDKGTPVTNTLFRIETGYLFHLSSRYHLTPYAGIGFFTSSLTDREKERLDIDPDIPTSVGFQGGIAFDMNFLPPLSDETMGGYSEGAFTGARVDAGVFYSGLGAVRSGLGNTGFYFNIGLSLLGWGRERIYVFDEE